MKNDLYSDFWIQFKSRHKSLLIHFIPLTYFVSQNTWFFSKSTLVVKTSSHVFRNNKIMVYYGLLLRKSFDSFFDLLSL